MHRETLLRELSARFPDGMPVTDPPAIAPWLDEPRGLPRRAALAVLRPPDTRSVSEIVAFCHRNSIPVIPQGGRTGLAGGCIPSQENAGIILSLDRMNRIRAVEPRDNTLVAEAGCILADIRRVARGHNRLFPIGIASEGSCQIGGNLSTNAGGISVIRHGMARNLCLGLEVVLPDGEILPLLRRLHKDNTGYDLKQLFIGAEGTLGVITAAVLKLFPLPAAREVAIIAIPDPEAALSLLHLAGEQCGGEITALELVPRLGIELVTAHVPGCRDPLAAPSPWYVLVELCSGHRGGDLRLSLENWLGEALGQGLATDAVLALDERQATALWQLRENLSGAQTSAGAVVRHDVSVPVSETARLIRVTSELLEQACPGIRVLPFGHVGDGNIHFNVLQPPDSPREEFLARAPDINRIVYDTVAGMGGSFSAEHGVGQIRRGEMRRYRTGTELRLMRAIKTLLDPSGIMNPGKVIPDPP